MYLPLDEAALATFSSLRSRLNVACVISNPSQSLAVESRTGHHDDSALQFGIDGVPVHLIIIPLLIF